MKRVTTYDTGRRKALHSDFTLNGSGVHAGKSQECTPEAVSLQIYSQHVYTILPEILEISSQQGPVQLSGYITTRITDIISSITSHVLSCISSAGLQ